tara:strand:+ start:7050 stop:7871 length:822 start_codon:yes stop_codon:yes gene_type:complete
MDLKSKYEFVSKFKEVVRVEIFHDYFTDGNLKFFEIKPELDTIKLMKSYGLLFKKIDNGFVIISEINDRFKTSSFNSNINLEFNLFFKDDYFLNYTDLPLSNMGTLLFENKFKNILHKTKYVTNKCIHNTDNKIIGKISLDFDESHGFFGKTSKALTKNLSYKIFFKSRNILLRYNLITSANNVKRYFITNEEDDFKLKKFEKRQLASKKTVYSFVIDNQFQTKEIYDFRFFLKKDDDFFKSFLVSLAHPEKKNISFNSSENLFYGDVFVNMD